MNVTFMIGNGFDLRLGMNTRFSDMYDGYIKSPSASAVIADFKETLKADAPKYKTWGDFEMAMALEANNLGNEDEFVEALRDFKRFLVDYLRSEEENFLQKVRRSNSTTEKCRNEMLYSVENFYKKLTPNVVSKLNDLGIDGAPDYCAITFNYTESFDILSEIAGGYRITRKMNEIVHVHGKLDSDIVLGVDSLEQVAKLHYKTTRKFERAFIKPFFNQSYDLSRITAAERIIKNSDVICIYGMSLGDSDRSWLSRIREWLLADQRHHLVRFIYKPGVFAECNWDAVMDEEDERIEDFLEILCTSPEEKETLRNQIHIPVLYDIFKISEIIDSETQRLDDEAKRIASLKKQMANRPNEIGV